MRDNDKFEAARSGKAGLSWVAMVGILAAGLLVAGAIAYRLVSPFFHHR